MKSEIRNQKSEGNPTLEIRTPVSVCVFSNIMEQHLPQMASLVNRDNKK
jgi:hypothetical protein